MEADYIFYSTIPFPSIEQDILELVKTIWPNCYTSELERTDNMLWIFYARDEEMYDDPEIAYNLDANGEGCFSLISSVQINFDKIGAFLDHERKATHEARFILNSISQYTLVLPEYIEDSPFARKVYDLITGFFTNESLPEEELPDLKPAQYYIRNNTKL